MGWITCFLISAQRDPLLFTVFRYNTPNHIIFAPVSQPFLRIFFAEVKKRLAIGGNFCYTVHKKKGKGASVRVPAGANPHFKRRYFL